jgi:hypothetical protein
MATTGGDSLKIPVVWTEGNRITRDGVSMCPLSLTFTGEKSVLLGRSILEKYDVTLDSNNGFVRLNSIDLGWIPPLPERGPTLYSLRAVKCQTFALSVVCVGLAARSAEEPKYHLKSLTDSELTVLPLKFPRNPFSSIRTPLLCSDSRAQVLPDGTVRFTVNLDAGGNKVLRQQLGGKHGTDSLSVQLAS